MEMTKPHAQTTNDSLTTTILATGIQNQSSRFHAMLNDPDNHSKKAFQAAIDYLSRHEAEDHNLLDQLKTCYDAKMQKAKNIRASRGSFCVAPATVFRCEKISNVNTAKRIDRSRTQGSYQSSLETIHEQYNDTDDDNESLYPTSDHDTMYLVMVNMSEDPTQYQLHQLQQALDDLNALPSSPKAASIIKERIFTIETQRKTPFSPKVIDTLRNALLEGLSSARNVPSHSLQTNSPC
ncbi:MAG: hypothetical protein CL816_02015 [Coxiellaceae bacterium]|nr:hypothetical protein [Coxiellaceae bacterium]|tara:strand:- start:1102 stop:1812 length:711 start_codon:yes stop_codon:yes gene_type:complete